MRRPVAVWACAMRKFSTQPASLGAPAALRCLRVVGASHLRQVIDPWHLESAVLSTTCTSGLSNDTDIASRLRIPFRL